MKQTFNKLVLLMLFLVSYGYCSAQHLQKAFDEISTIEWFTKIPYTCEEYGLPKELGTMQMVGCGNSDARDKVLEILQNVPQNLLSFEHVDDRGKITRFYIEEMKEGGPYMMQIFIGLGGNDLCPMLFTGGTIQVYKSYVEKIKKSFSE